MSKADGAPNAASLQTPANAPAGPQNQSRHNQNDPTRSAHFPCADTATPPAQWRIIGASVTGLKHGRRGQPCQDASRHHLLPGGDVLVAVADGAGSAACAQEGAQIVVDAAVQSVVEKLSTHIPLNAAAWRVVVQDAFRAARDAVRAHAAATNQPTRAYAATLILLLLGDTWTVCGSVGDCAVVVEDAAGRLQSLCPPQRGEYANTTNFATHEQADQWLDIHIRREPVRNAAILSDGLLEMAMNVACNQPFAPFFQPLFSFAAAATDKAAAQTQIHAFLDSDRVNARTSDDKTLVLVHRLAPSANLDSGASSDHGADDVI